MYFRLGVRPRLSGARVGDRMFSEMHSHRPQAWSRRRCSRRTVAASGERASAEGRGRFPTQVARQSSHRVLLWQSPHSVDRLATHAPTRHCSRRFVPEDSDAAPLSISPATVQGLDANVAKWAGLRMSRIRRPTSPFAYIRAARLILSRSSIAVLCRYHAVTSLARLRD